MNSVFHPISVVKDAHETIKDLVAVTFVGPKVGVSDPVLSFPVRATPYSMYIAKIPGLTTSAATIVGSTRSNCIVTTCKKHQLGNL